MAEYQLRLEEINLENWRKWALTHSAEVLAVVRLQPCLPVDSEVNHG